MSSDAPRVQLPRPHRAGFPGAAAVIVGVVGGAMLGHPFIGGLVGLVLWYRYRTSREAEEE